MAGWWVLWLGSPAKLTFWLSSRVAAWTGSFMAWKKLRYTPNRTRRLLVWMLVINAVAWLAWAGALWCWARFKHGRVG